MGGCKKIILETGLSEINISAAGNHFALLDKSAGDSDIIKKMYMKYIFNHILRNL